MQMSSESKDCLQETLTPTEKVLESCEAKINQIKTKITICGGREQTKIWDKGRRPNKMR